MMNNTKVDWCVIGATIAVLTLVFDHLIATYWHKNSHEKHMRENELSDYTSLGEIEIFLQKIKEQTMSDCRAYKDGKHRYHIRHRALPTRRHKFDYILVDGCHCGAKQPVQPEKLNEKQLRWIERWNARQER